MTEFFPSEKGVPIRYPSVANLMVDSKDRTEPLVSSPWDFQITKKYSTANGYFTRIGTTEVVLEWCANNISPDLSNNLIFVDISGTGMSSYFDTIDVELIEASMTIEEVLDAIVADLNTQLVAAGESIVFTVNPNNQGGVTIDCSGAYFFFEPSKLSEQLDLSLKGSSPFVSTPTSTYLFVDCPDIRPYRFIDFISSDLTYCQDVKDSTTNDIARDVLCRWYFSEDTQESYDGYGFPILMGYRRFCRRRTFNPPKQIKWEANLPIGNMRFQVYGDDQKEIVNVGFSKSNWLMTLQLSEV